jgi:ferredoxin
MSDAYTVRLLPVDVEFGVQEDETVLNAAFRQGIALPHGCKEGQCASCKSILVDGEVDLLKYSTFALNDMERDSGHILLCRSLPQSDIEVELLNYDEERHLADFVQTQDAAVGELELARPTIARSAGEGARHVAEQLGAEELLGDGPAIYRYERRIRLAARLGMDETRE